MLCEIANVHQQDARAWRRWVCDDDFDLFVWKSAEPGTHIVGFRLCYDTPPVRARSKLARGQRRLDYGAVLDKLMVGR